MSYEELSGLFDQMILCAIKINKGMEELDPTELSQEQKDMISSKNIALQEILTEG